MNNIDVRTHLRATSLRRGRPGCVGHRLSSRFLPFHAWGLATLIAVCTLVLISLGHSGDVGVAAITTGAVMVIAALGPHHAWQQPLIGVAGTAVGIAIGLAASWVANSNVADGLGRRPAARGG